MRPSRPSPTAAALPVLLLAALWTGGGAAAAERPVPLPPPALDQASGGAEETVVLAGGCFWGIQAVFQHVEGVTRAVSGYAGGDAASASYARVSTGATGHAESVAVTFDPARVSFGTILRVFFSVAHDPTERDRQGADVGPQYRSAIFTTTESQQRTARAYVDQLDRAAIFRRPVATRVEGAATFYPAEAYHQDYATRHPDDPYIAYTDRPKVDALERLYPELYRAAPRLVSAQ